MKTEHGVFLGHQFSSAGVLHGFILDLSLNSNLTWLFNLEFGDHVWSLAFAKSSGTIQFSTYTIRLLRDEDSWKEKKRS